MRDWDEGGREQRKRGWKEEGRRIGGEERKRRIGRLRGRIEGRVFGGRRTDQNKEEYNIRYNI